MTIQMNWKRMFLLGLVAILAALMLNATVWAEEIPLLPSVTIGLDGAESPKQVSVLLQILLLLTVLSLAPAILVMMTSFTRLAVVFSMVRQAIGTQQMPPNQILIGLALLLTFFTAYCPFRFKEKPFLSSNIWQLRTTKYDP